MVKLKRIYVMNRILGVVFLAFFSFSCSSNLDFDQVNDFKSEPVIVANLATFDVAANQFVEGGVEQIVSGDLMSFDIFNESFLNTNLNRVDFFFEIDNTINRAFKMDLYFLDDTNQVVYRIPFDVPASTGVQNLVTKTEIFENANLDLLKKSTKIAFIVTMYPGTMLDENSLGSLKLRSSATLYFNIE